MDELSPQDRGAIIAFADQLDIDPTHLEEGKEMGFTTDKNALRNVVNFLDSKIGWDTPLYDAIYKSIRMVSVEPAGKRAVIVMTDGRDERDNAQGVPVKDAGSLTTPDDPINEANRHNIPVFSIGLAGQGAKIDARYLGRLSERTGGVYQEAPEPEELTPLFQNVVEQLKQQYTLSYDSGLTEDDSEHSIMVRVKLPQGQAFSETKFRFHPQTTPDPQATEPNEPTPLAVAQSDASSPSVATGTPEPAPSPDEESDSTGFEAIVDTVKDTIEDDPLLAVVIGAGVLLLIVLIVALLIVLLRGRRAEEPYYGDEFEDIYAPAPSAMLGETPAPPGRMQDGSARPTAGPPPEERTEVAPPDWPQAGVGAPPPVGMSGGPARGAPRMPAAGGTRVIERAPKHLAMLVDRSRPDRKYDLEAITNIGREKTNQIVLEHPTASRHHAWIKAEGKDFLVFDVGSANGTYVNDESVEAPRRLEHGDIVRFGEEAFVFTRVF